MGDDIPPTPETIPCTFCLRTTVVNGGLPLVVAVGGSHSWGADGQGLAMALNHGRTMGRLVAC